MATLPDTVPLTGARAELSARQELKAVGAAPPVLAAWLRAQSVNVNRHAAALRPFRREEFGSGPAAPSEGHIQAVNFLIEKLRTGLLDVSDNVHRAITETLKEPSSRRLQSAVRNKDRAHRWVQGIEKIW